VFPPADYIPIMEKLLEELGESAKILIPKMPWGQLEGK
jgi:putative transposon-encoded protein